MHGRHASLRSAFIWFVAGLLSVVLPRTAAEESSDPASEGTESPLAVHIDAERVTQISCRVAIRGTLSTPATDGLRRWNLKSSASLKFLQRQLPSELSGPLALQAVRRYTGATTSTTVGKDYRTTTTLPRSSAIVHVRGADERLMVASAASPLSRRQFDLLQMPCDPLFCAALLPSRDVQVGEKWNTDAWVLPRLAGLEAVTDHTLSCELESHDQSIARISFSGKAGGAVLGSASDVELNGTLTLNTDSGLLTDLKCTMKEQRSAGPVSPGIEATIDIEWTQKAAEEASLPEELNEALFDRPLSLQTPWRLMIQHSPEWHIFNQNKQVVMLRQMRDGALIAQCNISSGDVMPPGKHTSDPDFRTDVEAAIQQLGGQIVQETTLRDDTQWRIRHVRTAATVNKAEIIRDYYLCTAPSGEQYSLMFSHSAADSEAFGDESARMLKTLALARRRPALPFRN